MRLVWVSVCCCSFIYSSSYQADQRNLFPRRTEHLGLHPSLYLTSLICCYSHELAFVMSNQSCLNELLLLRDTVYWHVPLPSLNSKEDHNKKHGLRICRLFKVPSPSRYDYRHVLGRNPYRNSAAKPDIL